MNDYEDKTAYIIVDKYNDEALTEYDPNDDMSFEWDRLYFELDQDFYDDCDLVHPYLFKTKSEANKALKHIKKVFKK